MTCGADESASIAISSSTDSMSFVTAGKFGLINFHFVDVTTSGTEGTITATGLGGRRCTTLLLPAAASAVETRQESNSAKSPPGRIPSLKIT